MQDNTVLEENDLLVENEDDAPVDYYCPITSELMDDPVFTCDGQTYSREGIEDWFEYSSISPNTGEELANKKLTPNYHLKSRIDQYKKEKLHPNLSQEDVILENKKNSDETINLEQSENVQNNQITKPSYNDLLLFNDIETKKTCAREISLFCTDLTSYIAMQCMDDGISTDKTCAFVNEALTFLVEPSQQSTTLNMYLLHKNVHKKVADYMTAYIEKHSDITHVNQNRQFFDAISNDLQDNNLDKIKFRGGLIDQDPDEQEQAASCTSSFGWTSRCSSNK